MKRTLAFALFVLLTFSACGKVELHTGDTTATVALTATAETAVPAATDLSPVTAPTETTVSPVSETAATVAAETARTATTAAAETQTVIVSVSYAPTAAQTTTAAPPVSAAHAPKPAAPPATEAPKTTAPPATEAPKPTAPPTTEKPKNTCTVRIECKTILDNLKKLKAGKAAFVPQSGVILADAAVEVRPGDTAFTVLQRACEENVCTDNCKYCRNGGIQLEYTYTPGFNTYYVEGVHQLYEKDCGALSGWMFSLNGAFPEEGASSVTVSPGDRIEFVYTCDMGDDVGNHFEG